MGFKIGSTVNKFTIGSAHRAVLAVALACSALSISCAKNSEQTTLSENEYTFETPEKLKEAVNAFTITCDGKCPESVGVLLAIETKDLKIRTCTFSLVGQNTILTNRHCIPDSIAQDGGACDGKIQALFIKNGVKETYACKTVLTLPEKYNADEIAQRDYAFVELTASPGRPVLAMNTEGLKDTEILRSIVASPYMDEEKPASKLHEIKCQTLMNSNLVPNFTSPKSPVVGFKGCNIVPGNSGAPLLGEDGRLKAILQAGTRPEKGEKHASKTPSAKAPAWANSKFAIGTNAACLDAPSLGISSAASGCDFSSPTYTVETSTTAFDEAADTKLKEQYAKDLNRAVPSFKFKYAVHVASETEQANGLLWTFQAEPTCIVGAPGKIPWLQGRAVSGPKMRISFQSYVFNYNSDIDEDARYVLKRTAQNTKVVALLPVKELQSGTQTQFTVLTQTSSTQRSFNIGWCNE